MSVILGTAFLAGAGFLLLVSVALLIAEPLALPILVAVGYGVHRLSNVGVPKC